LERLRKRSDFVNASKTGEYFVTPAFVVQLNRRTSEGPFRCGITASRKVGGAVERNRAKRRLRTLLRLTLPPLARPGIDYVLIARQEVLKRGFDLMCQELKQALKKLHERG